MARIFQAPSKALLNSLRSGNQRSICECLNANPSRRYDSPRQRRNLSTASSQLSEMEIDSKTLPRWARTPPAMKAPVSMKPRSEDYKPFKTNSDPARLDEMYKSLLGSNGDQLISEETKWLAVTHKSFDQGRRGFNERLAYLGKRLIELQLSLGMLNATSSIQPTDHLPDPHGRQPFQHPALENIEILTGNTRSALIHHKRFYRLARKHGMQDVIRWQPKNPENLQASGSSMVYAQSICAIIGAIALERGGAIANEIAREKILRSIGLGLDSEELPQPPADDI